jgi:phenylacetate-CoA ligase
MHPLLSQFLFYRPAHAVRGEKVERRQREIEEYYSKPAHVRREIQWNKLTALLEFVYQNNAYYRELFDGQGIRPASISHPDDLRKIPFLDKTSLQTADERILSERAPRSFVRHTSGSSGIPLALRKDIVASSYMAALMYHAYGWYGIQPGDRQARVWGIPFGARRKWLTGLKDWTLNRRRLSAFDISPRSCAHYYKSLLRFRPKFMYGLPSTISALALTLQEIELDPARIGLEVIISTGEILFESDRAKISKAFGCRVVNEYGTTENGLIAFESPEGRMIEMTHNQLVEVVDPDTGKPLAPGQEGEICVTELHSYGVPLIRYLVGDIVVQRAENAVDNESSPELERVVGRVSDLIVCPDGRKVAAAVLDYAFGPAVRRFKAHQRSLSHLEIWIEKGDAFSSQALTEAERSLRDIIGDSMEFEFRVVDSFPMHRSGKMTVLESDLPAAEGEQRPGASWSPHSTDSS